jgi:hypothetical protein
VFAALEGLRKRLHGPGHVYFVQKELVNRLEIIYTRSEPYVDRVGYLLQLAFLALK